jgi:hypothetical protein
MHSRLLVIILALLFISPVYAQDKLLTLDDLYDPSSRVNFNGNPPTGMVWLDETSYLFRGRKINALSGQEQPFYDSGKMEAALAKLPGMTAAEAKRLAAGRFEMNPARTGALINYANDLFYYQFGSENMWHQLLAQKGYIVWLCDNRSAAARGSNRPGRYTKTSVNSNCETSRMASAISNLCPMLTQDGSGSTAGASGVI